MTSEQLINAFVISKNLSSKEASTSDRINPDTVICLGIEPSHEREIAAHINFMCDEGIKLVELGKIEKAMRWLGFVQGVLWTAGYISIAELKDINR